MFLKSNLIQAKTEWSPILNTIYSKAHFVVMELRSVRIKVKVKVKSLSHV